MVPWFVVDDAVKEYNSEEVAIVRTMRGVKLTFGLPNKRIFLNFSGAMLRNSDVEVKFILVTDENLRHSPVKIKESPEEIATPVPVAF